MEKVTLCYCANRNMHLPLCVSAYTALLHLDSEHYLDLHVFQDNFRSEDHAELRRCLDQANRKYDLKISQISLRRFSGFDALHGDKMPWGRLKLPEILPDRKKIIYLDADTVVLTDLAELYHQKLGSAALGAVPGGKLRHALDHEFFQHVNLDLGTSGFNSGVLLFDVDQWLREGWEKSVMSFAEKHKGKYLSHDQSVLNCVFHKKFYQLPKHFNRRAYPDRKLERKGNSQMIAHFVGSPKPWDLFGSLLHENYDLFHACATRVGATNSLNKKLGWSSLKRTLRLARSYYTLVRKKIER